MSSPGEYLLDQQRANKRDPVPVGIIPKYAWKARRMNELFDTILRYIDKGLVPQREWVEELAEHWKEFPKVT